MIDEASTDFAAIRPDEWQQICPTCGGQKARVEFAVDKHRPSGRKPLCKACDSARSLERYYRLRGEVPTRTCEECGTELEGRRKVVCSSTCAERRWRRLNPEEAARKQREKRARRRERAT